MLLHSKILLPYSTETPHICLSPHLCTSRSCVHGANGPRSGRHDGPTATDISGTVCVSGGSGILGTAEGDGGASTNSLTTTISSLREEMIQSTMIKLRAADEEKKRQLEYAKLQAEIEVEARLRIETEKLNAAIENNDTKVLQELAGRSWLQGPSGSPCDIVRTKARQILEENAKKQMHEIANARQRVIDSEKEVNDSIRELIRKAFVSYYSTRHAHEYKPDLYEGHKARVEISSTMFKKNQQALKDYGITSEHFKNPNLNRVRIRPAFDDMGRNANWRNVVIDMSFLLTEECARGRPHDVVNFQWLPYEGVETVGVATVGPTLPASPVAPTPPPDICPNAECESKFWQTQDITRVFNYKYTNHIMYTCNTCKSQWIGP